MTPTQEVFGISIVCITLLALLCDLLSEIFKDTNEQLGWVGCHINWHLIFTTV